MKVWNFIQTQLEQGLPVVLLYVLDSQGSSPGRQGFKMAVSQAGEMIGTIGGGIMEHKWVERAREMMRKGENQVLFTRQYHDKMHSQDQSGMICSGEQSLAILPLGPGDLPAVQAILSTETAAFQIDQAGLKTLSGVGPDKTSQAFSFTSYSNWQYVERTDQRPRIHIFGGGHVSLALSEIMAMLDFYVIVYEDRQGLNTWEENTFAHEKYVIDYQNIGKILPDAADDFVVIMTFGYRPDKIIFKQLLGKSFRYLGMMGSEAKINQLFQELEAEGLAPETWQHVHAPIGISIYSKTAKEIGISIAAEIIAIKNMNLPSGRSG